jgi:glutamate-1-semialdehyde 2,1-aminomutase
MPGPNPKARLARSRALWDRANRVLVGGVNSPVRAFKAVGGHPFFAASGKGARLRDVDGNEYIDYVLSWGPLILGHAHPRVVEAVTLALEKGASFGVPTEAEILLAEKIARLVPCVEKVRLVNSGTEATMSAVRLARGVTGRDLILKIEGCYHGHVDGLLVAAGSGPTTFGAPTSPGIPKSHAQTTLTVPYNDPDAMEAAFTARGREIACLILEPVPGNMGLVTPAPGYLEEVRRLTKHHGALLIFDEVMSGFRVSMGGAQERFGVTPDLVTLGKVIGGGLPVGAYGGPASLMDEVSPVGKIYQAGTLSGNPLATAAGLATLEVLEKPGTLDRVERVLTELGAGLQQIAEEAGVPLCLGQAGAMAGLFFKDGDVMNYQDALKSDTQRYAKFFNGMLERGVYFAPSQFEAYFGSTEHGEAEIDQTLEAAREVFGTF